MGSSQEGGPGQDGGLPAGLGAAWRSEHPVWPEVPIRQEKLAIWVLSSPMFLRLCGSEPRIPDLISQRTSGASEVTCPIVVGKGALRTTSIREGCTGWVERARDKRQSDSMLVKTWENEMNELSVK